MTIRSNQSKGRTEGSSEHPTITTRMQKGSCAFKASTRRSCQNFVLRRLKSSSPFDAYLNQYITDSGEYYQKISAIHIPEGSESPSMSHN